MFWKVIFAAIGLWFMGQHALAGETWKVYTQAVTTAVALTILGRRRTQGTLNARD